MNMNWNDIRYFLAIARAGSLTQAARILSVSQPTVSRRLANMETAFSVKLFNRTKYGYNLTAAGHEIYEVAQHIADEMDEIGRKIYGQDRQLTGIIRLTCTEVMANLYLAKHFNQFTELNPEINLSIKCTFENLSLSRREADIALRITSQPPDTLIGRRLTGAALAVYTSAHTPMTYSIEQCTWIGWQDETYNREIIYKSFPKARIKHKVDDMQTMRAMVRNGLGVAIFPCYMADTDNGLRRAIPAPIEDNGRGLWILYHTDMKRVTRLKRFTDFISNAIIEDRDLFEGRQPQM